MIYFMCFMTFICALNLLIMGLVVWKFGWEVFVGLLFSDAEKPTKEAPLERTH